MAADLLTLLPPYKTFWLQIHGMGSKNRPLPSSALPCCMAPAPELQPISVAYAGWKNQARHRCGNGALGATGKGKETPGLFPGEHQTVILTCVENQEETQKSQAHLPCPMPAEPLHYGLWLPAGLAALGERNTMLVVLKFAILYNFVQPLSQNDVTMREILAL